MGTRAVTSRSSSFSSSFVSCLDLHFCSVKGSHLCFGHWWCPEAHVVSVHELHEFAIFIPTRETFNSLTFLAIVAAFAQHAEGHEPQSVYLIASNFKSGSTSLNDPWIIMILYRYHIVARQKTRAEQVLLQVLLRISDVGCASIPSLVLVDE